MNVKTKNLLARKQPLAFYQSGMATILIVLLVGVSMTAIAMGITHSVKSAQQKQVAAHASTNAQVAAWAAAQAFKQYLSQIDYDTVKNWQPNTQIPIAISNVNAKLSATIVDVDLTYEATEGLRVTTNIRARDPSAMSTSALQVIFSVGNATCTLCQSLASQIDLFDETNLTGDITLEAPANMPMTVNIEGDVNAMHIALTGLSRLNATGDITLGSAVPIDEVFTNTHLLLDGNATVAKASALGDVTLKNNGRANIIYANGDVEMDGGVTQAVNNLGNVEIIKWAMHDTVISAGTVSVGAPIQKVQAKGQITLNQWADARDIKTEATLTCPSPYWTMYDRLESGGAMSNCPSPSAKTLPNSAGVNVPVMQALDPVTFQRPIIDAWAVKSEANYIFEFIANTIRVTVQNVSGVANGTYFLGRYPYEGGRDHLQYLCDVIDNSGNCTSPASRTKTICQGHSTSNACFSYSASTWTIDGRNMPPGIAWFEGNLLLANGQYYNSFFATGNISTAGSLKTYAPNYIGFNAICNNQFPLNPISDFADLKPSNLCNTSAIKYTAIGNVALAAGGYDPNMGGQYVGGNITLGASNEIFGTVLAGSYFDTLGDTIVHGYVSAAANRQGTGSNDLGGKTVIKLNNLPPGYKPDEIPLFDSNGNCQANCASGGAPARVMWSRYL